MTYLKQTNFQKYFLKVILLWVTLIISGCNSGGGGPINSGLEDLTANEITAFYLNDTPGTIIDHNITVNLPRETDITALKAKFTTTGKAVSVGGLTQISEVTTNHFGSPVVYIVTAANGSTQNYTVIANVSSTYFVGYYPTGCTPNNAAAGVDGTCECIQDPNTHTIWYADGSKTGTWSNWAGGGRNLATFSNMTPHCGLKGGWTLPSAPHSSQNGDYISSTNPGGQWGEIATAAKMNNGTGFFPFNMSYSIGTWMNNNGFENINTNTLYWSNNSTSTSYAVGVYMNDGSISEGFQNTYSGVLLVHSGL